MNLTQNILITCCCIATLGSCKKDKPTPDNYISFQVDGVYKKLIPEANSSDDGNWLLIAGPLNKGELDLFLDTSIYLKSYNLANEADHAMCTYYNDAGTRFWNDSGTMVISSYDGENISGTFAFKARTPDSAHSTIRITEGQFSAKVEYFSTSSDTSDWNFPPVEPIGTDTCSWSNSRYGVNPRQKLLRRHLQHTRLVFRRAVQ
jgi:hypothetical protein